MKTNRMTKKQANEKCIRIFNSVNDTEYLVNNLRMSLGVFDIQAEKLFGYNGFIICGYLMNGKKTYFHEL